jgi:hypothetical protein
VEVTALDIPGRSDSLKYVKDYTEREFGELIDTPARACKRVWVTPYTRFR